MKQKLFWVAALAAVILSVHSAQSREVMSLAGPWRFALDPRGEGISNRWYQSCLSDSIPLPGTTDEARKGPGNPRTNEVMQLTRRFPFKGMAWYQRDVVIPKAWAGQRLTLLLERTKHTTVWVDDRCLGEQDSLAVGHLYDLTEALSPGAHRLTVLVNNQKAWPVFGHQLAEDTQTDWNGILGRIELRATAKVWLEDVQVFPDVLSRKLRARITVGNLTAEPGAGTIVLTAGNMPGHQEVRFAPVHTRFADARNGSIVAMEYQLGRRAQLWDEFAPVLYQLNVQLSAGAGTNRFSDHYALRFGLGQFSTRGTQFTINGRPTFLRGKQDACVFPLTGYAPMDLDGWRRYFEICRSYGINHVRFHTWCPPEAAFEAADLLGIYLQPELPNFGGDFSQDLPRQAYSRAEGRRILQAFGNHPSFVMFALGNENSGGREVRADMVREFRSLDNRRLYAQASNYDFNQPHLAAGDDYWTTMRTAPGEPGNVRGAFSHADKPLGHLQTRPPSTVWNYEPAIASVPVPVIGHEVGQYQVFPNFTETAKYTGVLQACNFRVFQQRFAAKGMLDQAPEFMRASGALAVLCYREEIEAALRTKGFGGFQLLDLQDFPGQGTALVGILDAFMESKGLVSPEAWREFCSPIVPLAVFQNYTWTTDEAFTAQVKLANYSATGLPQPVICWSLLGPERRIVAAGRLASGKAPAGGLAELGTIRTSLADVVAPAKLELVLNLQGTSVSNRYALWAYPPAPTVTPPADVFVARKLDPAALNRLAAGGKVLLLPEPIRRTNSVEGFFAPDFWCYPMFRNICQANKVPAAPGTLGLLVQQNHPALANFPTEFHSNWQWWSIVMNSRPLILDRTPVTFRPIVQVIDNFERNHKLGLLFEARVGAGRLLVCTADLTALRDHPEARQLWASLLEYMGSQRFAPSQALSPESFWD